MAENDRAMVAIRERRCCWSSTLYCRSSLDTLTAIILLGFELFFTSAAESCDEEELTIMTRNYLSEMGLEDEMVRDVALLYS